MDFGSLDYTEIASVVLGALLTKLVQFLAKRFGIKLSVSVKPEDPKP